MKVNKGANLVSGGAPDKGQLEKINALTKGTLTAEDVYVFSVRLCDDQIDRDFERFSQEALKELAPMFIGRTGITDHAWSADRQVARIFDTSVEYEAGAMFIKAWAYILRCEQNEGVIRDIEGGIKKEVSVGCAMKRAICSVCGADYGSCEHRKGECYGGETCVAVLCEPTDAYEFSFVAVPAQKDAGVLKKLGESGMDTPELKKLQKEAELGRLYRRELENRAVCAALVLECGVEEAVLRSMVKSVSAEDLGKLEKALTKKMAERISPVSQLHTDMEGTQETDSAFLI